MLLSMHSAVTAFSLLVCYPLWGQPPAWHAGIAKVACKPDLKRSPGTAFVVALEGGRAYLVTSAHVVEGDASPEIEFVADRGKPYRAVVRHIEAGEERGLALLVVDSLPAKVRVLQEAGPPRPDIGENVLVVGFPAALGEFSAFAATIARTTGRDLFLSRDTDEGFSGGPVVRNGAVAGIVYGREGSFGKALGSANVRVYLEGHALSWGRDSSPSAPPVASEERSRQEILKLTAAGIEYVRRVDLSYVKTHAHLPFFVAGYMVGTREALNSVLSDATATVRRIAETFELVNVTAHPVRDLRSRGWFPSVTRMIPIPVEDTDWAALIAAGTRQQPPVSGTFVAFFRSEEGTWRLLGVTGGEGNLK